MSRSSDIELLLRILDQAFDTAAWHGTTLAGSLRGLSADAARWRPAAGRHNVWELALHTAYWKYVVRRRLTGEKRGAFPRDGSNWPRVPDQPSAAAWKADVELLKSQHAQLRQVVAALPPAALGKKGATGKWTNAELIHGVAAHDLYHAGQIQLIKRLRRG